LALNSIALENQTRRAACRTERPRVIAGSTGQPTEKVPIPSARGIRRRSRRISGFHSRTSLVGFREARPRAGSSVEMVPGLRAWMIRGKSEKRVPRRRDLVSPFDRKNRRIPAPRPEAARSRLVGSMFERIVAGRDGSDRREPRAAKWPRGIPDPALVLRLCSGGPHGRRMAPR
jgi:hypothetical protein